MKSARRRTESIRVRLTLAELRELDELISSDPELNRSSYVRRLIRLDMTRHRLLGN